MAAAPWSLGTQFQEELSCSICLELFTRPKVLPCQHTFCQDCLEDHVGRGGTFQCPNCRLQFRLPRQGVTSLPDNLMAANMCERLQNQATQSGETREQPQSGNRCTFHPSEEVKLYCKHCKVPVCNDCLDEMHSDHGTITLKKASRERKAPVQALIDEGRNVLEDYCGVLKSLREEEKTLDEQKQETDNSIIQAYNHLLFQAEEKYNENKEVVQEERDRVLADVSELSAACDQAEQELEQGGVTFLGQERILTKKIVKYRGKLQKAAPVQPQPVQPPNNLQTAAGILLLAVFLIYGPLPKTITFGGKGSGNGQFNNPSGVAVSSKGEIFVADSGNQRIQVFTLQGTFVRQFPTCTVVSGGQKMTPHDVVIDEEGNPWVVGNTETTRSAVQYDKQGRVLRKFGVHVMTGWYRGVAVDTRQKQILITQTTEGYLNRQGLVLVFRSDGSLLRTVGQQQGMENPRYIIVDGEGKILVSDYDNHYVYVYKTDKQFLFKFGGKGSGEGQLKNPQGICTDRAGNIIVADPGNSRVEMFDKTGRFLKHISTDTLTRPEGVTIGPQGQLVVTDSADHTVHIIQSY
ncbi:TRIM3 [Branchiostoma lanceolatum]|uniref:RING-type E3 ubiquitin transferase n=1 Tax=Branchiostoma lanceolatum TaxID=7740 RepID=A0A8J9YXZ4_BRALA|nr:TRIM3 [Branchiostoma lanceolatum]